MIVLAAAARRHVRALQEHDEARDRLEAAQGLRTALTAAWGKITADPAAGLPAPRPYPRLAQPGRAWIKAGRYWIAYSTRPPVAIVAVFYDAANIPGRR